LDQNALVLPDPERIISRTHARVDFQAGSYLITALGQNPIDLNGRPLSAGEPAQLSSEDKLTIGDYIVVASVEPEEAESALAGILGRPSRLAEPFERGLVEEPEAQMAFGISLTGGSPSAPSERKSEQAGPPPLSMRGSQQRDELPAVLEPLPSTRPVSPIPDDYDLLRGLEGEAAPPGPGRTPVPPAAGLPEDPFAETVPLQSEGLLGIGATPTAPESERTKAAPAAPAVEAPAAPAAEISSPPGGDYARAVRAFLDAVGLPELQSRALADPDFMHEVGDLLREAIAGLLKALVARSLTKGELHLDMTMLAAVENNPLKFSPNAYEALLHLLAPRPAAGYLPPLRAVREAYQDLEAHNLAVMAGMRAALLGVLDRFDPTKLEKRLAAHPLLDKLLPVNRKARMWDLVAEQHSNLVREAQDEFDRIFGRAFREAYAEQVEKLRAPTKRSSSLP
jgi:FHA domain-containing protein/type VI secretion system protein